MVNRHDGGASLLKSPCRIREIVAAVREAVPPEIPVSAKLRLGWESIDSIFENAAMAVEGGASWITIHARTRVQGYLPPVYWPHVGRVRERVGVPVVANGDIWTIDDFRRCQDETGCTHYMIGRGALANPALPYEIAGALGLKANRQPTDWLSVLQSFVRFTEECDGQSSPHTVMRIKQWLKLASKYGDFPHFDAIKHTRTVPEFFEALVDCSRQLISR